MARALCIGLNTTVITMEAVFADARALKAYAGVAPVTRASARSISITHRKVKNDRLAAAGYLWAFVAATHAQPAKQHYQRQRDHGDRHPAALRDMFNRLLGCLHHCLATGQRYDPAKAFEARQDAAAA
ncbi:transposase [Micromonospora chokoriensis]